MRNDDTPNMENGAPFSTFQIPRRPLRWKDSLKETEVSPESEVHDIYVPYPEKEFLAGLKR